MFSHTHTQVCFQLTAQLVLMLPDLSFANGSHLQRATNIEDMHRVQYTEYLTWGMYYAHT